MFLRSIRLQHWACHHALDLELDPGLNVVVGPNGVGKSTLCGAIIAALTVKHSSKDRDLRQLEPWGVEGCGPTAELVLSRPDGEWRLAKTFIHEPSARLERREGNRWALRHRGKSAEEELTRWLDSDGAAGRLLLELWSPQVDPTRLFDTPSRNGRLSPSSILGASLADRLQATEATGPFALARRLVADQVAKSFTPVNRQVRVGSELQLAELARREAETRWLELSQRQDELSRRVEEYRRLEAEHRLHRQERDRLAEQADRRRADREAYRRRLETLRAAEDELRRLQDAVDRADRDHRRLLLAAEEANAAETRLAELEPRASSLAEEAGRAEADLQAAEHRRAEVASHLDELAVLLDRLNRLDDADRARSARLAEEQEAARTLSRAEAARNEASRIVSSAQEALARAEADRILSQRAELTRAVRDANARALAARVRYQRAQHRLLRAEADRLDRTLEQINARLAERSALGSPDDEPIPTEDQLRELRSRSAELDARAAALEADALSLRFEADRPISARLSADSEEEGDPIAIAAGGAIDARAIGSLILEIEGVGRVAISRTSAAPEERRRRLEADRQAFRDLLASFGAGSVEDLEARRFRADRRTALDAELAALLSAGTAESLRRRRDEIDQQLASLTLPADLDEGEPEDHPSIETLRSDADAADRALAVARDRLDAMGGDVDPGPVADLAEADRQVNQARQTLDEARLTLETAQLEVDRTRDRLVEARARLQDADRLLSEESGDDPNAASDLRYHISSIRQKLIVWDADPPGTTAQAVRLRRQAIENEVEQHRRRRDSAASALAELDRDRAAAIASRDAARRRLDELAAEGDDGGSPGDRAALLDDLRRDLHRAEARVLLLREELGSDPTADDDAFESLRRENAERCRQSEQDLAVLLRELELLGADGLDTRLAEASEKLDETRARFALLDRDASAWRLLDRILGEVESDCSRDVARQVEGLSARWVERLSGRNVRSVTLDPDSLSPVSALADASGLARALELFSRGTREQVALACRLQLGVLLSQDARQMILLDDPLAHTDPDRHGEALDVLTEVASSLQVVIFSCHLDRYARLWEEGRARRLSIVGPDRAEEPRPAVPAAGGLGP
ncbi:AAA family ATPase [Tautonia sociabilis]|uniref:Rad50/SbcC-type AAA domain-containing protein n=1 Tax=Tautonia sociabilis TaxID=2080755 RepID=A0A432MKQ1_9BACT|nr:AAA family ATPase [Tautonia sociabilis]RUL87716.1 hypothetical protein TsocGM_11055 [Tautonia sociabilis]